MELIDKLKDIQILVIPNNIKNKIIKELSKNSELLNVNFMTLEELIKKYTYDYNEQTIYYLMNKYNLKYEIALLYLNNTYYIEDKIYVSSKLNKLVEIKKELDNNNLLIKDQLFHNYLEKKSIGIYGYDYINKYQNKILSKLNIKIIENNNKQYTNQELYELNTLEEEVEFVAYKIAELIKSGTDINKIKLLNVNEDYHYQIKKIFNFYNIPVDLKEKKSIYATNIISLFISNLDININDNLESIKNNIDLNNDLNLNIYNKLINIINRYSFVDNLSKVKEMLIYEFKHTYVETPDLKNKVEILFIKDNILDNDNYYFLLSFNNTFIPIIHKDEEYISDNIKPEYIETTLELNKIEYNNTLNKIKQINNLIITYKLNYNNMEYYISKLNEDLNININKDILIPYTYSNIYNKIKLTKKIDSLIKYGKQEKDISLLYNNYNNIEYKTYNNAFTNINKEALEKFIDNKLLLSYSSMDNYYKCGFRYYLNNLLKISIYEETFMTLIGNLFHYILSIAFKPNFNLKEEYNKYLLNLNKEFSAKEKLFLNNLLEELKFIIETINKQYKNTSFDKSLYEEKIYVNKNTKITFMGIIDKLLYKDDNDKTLVAIIDYKTGNPNLNLNNTLYGLDMQLPVYLYLAKNSKLKNVEVVGFYLQKILNNEIVLDHKNTYLKLKENNLKLQGYSNQNETLLQQFDNTYNDSEMIKSLKTSSKGFYAYSKIIDTNKINKIINIVDKKIDECGKNILEAKFDINPKKVGKENIGCKYCKFKDICYMKEEDIIELKEYKNLEFLGDD